MHQVLEGPWGFNGHHGAPQRIKCHLHFHGHDGRKSIPYNPFTLTQDVIILQNILQLLLNTRAKF